MTTAVTSRQILAFLDSRYSAPQWAAFREVELRGRRLDFVAMGLWPSTRAVGHRAIGVEVKISRSDFMREIDDPSKRAPAETLMHECYFATPKGLVRPDEVPEGWGLLEVSGAGLRRLKAPTQRSPAPTWELVSQLARKTRYPGGNHNPENAAAPVAAWKYAGQDITEETLLKLAGDLWAAQLPAKIATAVREAMTEVQRDRLVEQNQLNTFFGHYGVDYYHRDRWSPERIRSELLGKEMSPAQRTRSIAAVRAAGRALAELEVALSAENAGLPEGVTRG